MFNRRFFSFRRLMLFLSVMGPGIIAANADNDAGGIATYTVSGARFGYQMLFPLLIITVILGITQELGGRIGVASGKGLGGVIRERFSLKLTLIAMLAMLVANVGVIIANMAGVAAGALLFGIPTYISVPITIIALWLLLYKGSFKKAERIFLVLSAVYIVYIITAVIVKPDWGTALKALVIPDMRLDQVYLLTLMALIGTTVTPWGQFFIQSYIVDKGTRPEVYGYQKLEMYLGAFLTNLISFFIIVTAANTLFSNGIVVQDASEAALSLAPLAGAQAKNLFALGLFNAGLLGVSIVTLATAYALCETYGFESGLDHTWRDAPVFYAIILAILIASGIFILIPGLPLFQIMIVTQAINGIILPVILMYVYKIANDHTIMGSFTNSRLNNFLAAASIALLSIASLAVVLISLQG
ncbi:MAG TPA: divalent metal cation transporter [bacterium]|nr:divalent metal cation transporter [bacterium]